MTRENQNLTSIHRVAALSRGQAVVHDVKYTVEHRMSRIVRINKHGSSVQTLYTCVDCNWISGTLVMGTNLYVLHGNGTMLEFSLEDNTLLKVYEIPHVEYVTHHGSLSAAPELIPDQDLLLLSDRNKHEIFTFRLSSSEKDIRVTSLKSPTSVSYAFSNNKTYIIVCEWESSVIKAYNSSWHHLWNIGEYGIKDGQLDHPIAAVVLSNGSVIVADLWNNRVSEFTVEGQFKGHLLAEGDGISNPDGLSFSYPYLWVLENYHLHRFKLYEYKGK